MSYRYFSLAIEETGVLKHLGNPYLTIYGYPPTIYKIVITTSGYFILSFLNCVD